MTFPIHPNNYNSLLPAPHQTEESNAFSDGIRRVRQLRSAQFECISLALVWIDIGLVTHQIVLDYSLSGQNVSDSNLSNWTAAHPEFRNQHPALTHQGSMALFITITTLSFAFLVEGIFRNIYSRITQRRFCALNVCDAILCAVSFAINLSLLAARVSPLARDFVALLIAFRLVRVISLVGGLTMFEKRQILRMLDAYRREESYNAEHQRMLQTELDNRTRECQDLRDLVKSATLARNRLKQKQQLQMKQQTSEEEASSITGAPKQGEGGQDDSGHSSDSSPDSPQEAFGRLPNDAGGGSSGGSCGGGVDSPSDIELTGVGLATDSQNENSVTSRM